MIWIVRLGLDSTGSTGVLTSIDHLGYLWITPQARTSAICVIVSVWANLGLFAYRTSVVLVCFFKQWCSDHGIPVARSKLPILPRFIRPPIHPQESHAVTLLLSTYARLSHRFELFWRTGLSPHPFLRAPFLVLCLSPAQECFRRRLGRASLILHTLGL
jgi:hypothetical protein